MGAQYDSLGKTYHPEGIVTIAYTTTTPTGEYIGRVQARTITLPEAHRALEALRKDMTFHSSRGVNEHFPKSRTERAELKCKLTAIIRQHNR